MLVWRISNHAARDGSGGLQASARWHSKGRRIVYCAPNPATALLEILVQLEIEPEDLPAHYQLIKIEIPDDIPHETIDPAVLPADWKTHVAVTRQLGDNWLAAERTMLLYVPCAIIPETYILPIPKAIISASSPVKPTPSTNACFKRTLLLYSYRIPALAAVEYTESR